MILVEFHSYVFELLALTILFTGVSVILVNIFGGIMRCDTVAAGMLWVSLALLLLVFSLSKVFSGLVRAAEILNLKKPLVVRLQGKRRGFARHF